MLTVNQLSRVRGEHNRAVVLTTHQIVVRVFIHPVYVGKCFQNDVALLKLAQPLATNYKIVIVSR